MKSAKHLGSSFYCAKASSATIVEPKMPFATVLVAVVADVLQELPGFQ